MKPTARIIGLCRVTLGLIVAGAVCAAADASPGGSTAEEIRAAHDWADAGFAKPNVSGAPFSFIYGGIPSEQLLPTWQYASQAHSIPGGTYHTITYSDPKTGLAIECRLMRYDEAAAIDWVFQLRNTGSQDTPGLERFMPLDTARLLEADAGAPPAMLRWSNGDGGTAESYLPHDEQLTVGTPRRFAAVSSDTTCLPFF